jgi:hypothetical protein
MFSRTDSATPAEGGGCLFGGGEGFCVAEFGVVEEATGFEGVGIGVVDFGVVDRPGNVRLCMKEEGRVKRGRRKGREGGRGKQGYHKFPRMVVPLGIR